MDKKEILEIIDKTIRKIIIELRDDPLPNGMPPRRVGRNDFLGSLSNKINKDLKKVFEQEFNKITALTDSEEKK